MRAHSVSLRPWWDSTTEVKRGKINHKSLSDLLRVETLICGAVGGGRRNPLTANMMMGSGKRGCNHVEDWSGEEGQIPLLS